MSDEPGGYGRIPQEYSKPGSYLRPTDFVDLRLIDLIDLRLIDLIDLRLIDLKPFGWQGRLRCRTHREALDVDVKHPRCYPPYDMIHIDRYLDRGIDVDKDIDK